MKKDFLVYKLLLKCEFFICCKYVYTIITYLHRQIFLSHIIQIFGKWGKKKDTE